MTKCSNCENKAFTPPNYIEKWCEECLLKHLEQRVKKTLKQTPIKPNENITIINNGTTTAKVTIAFTERILKGFPHKKTIIKIINENNILKNIKIATLKGKVIIPWNANNTIEEFLDYAFNNKSIQQTTAIKLLQNLTRQEIQMAQQTLKLPQKAKDRETPMTQIVALIEKTTPETMPALLKSAIETINMGENMNMRGNMNVEENIDIKKNMKK